MKEKTNKYLTELYASFETETEKLTVFRNELMKDRSYEIAHEIFRIECRIRALQLLTTELLKDIELDKFTTDTK
jgi:hypothetical protein